MLWNLFPCYEDYTFNRVILWVLQHSKRHNKVEMKYFITDKLVRKYKLNSELSESRLTCWLSHSRKITCKNVHSKYYDKLFYAWKSIQYEYEYDKYFHGTFNLYIFSHTININYIYIDINRDIPHAHAKEHSNRHVFGIIFIRYSSQNIVKPNNFKVFGSK